MFDSNKPYVRWWWLGGPFCDEDVRDQLDWIREHGFGGVELAWVFPSWLDESLQQEIPEWLGDEWSRLVAFAKLYCDEIGLGCDFTFGSAWPFGGRFVSEDDSSRRLDGESTGQLFNSWEEAAGGPPGRLLDHLSSRSLRNYAKKLGPSFEPALRGTRSSLFCDSFEVEKNRLWSPQLGKVFEARFGYAIEDNVSELDSDPDLLYDYRKFVGDTITGEFFATFSDLCHGMGANSRVQCHGAPADLLSAYAEVDIPESEALLFNPYFSRIPASAAALTGKKVVSCEIFTCLYGFPRGDTVKCIQYTRRENVADLKLLADSVFSNGVNQLVWHGMPYRPSGGRHEFYASVHVGPDSAFVQDLKEFNAYLENVSGALKEGMPVSQLAVYLPNEDYMRLAGCPSRNRVPGEEDYWEMRHIEVPPETEGYHPLWVSVSILRRAVVRDGRLHFDGLSVEGLYVDADWIDAEAVQEFLRLSREGLKIAVLSTPGEPGRRKSEGYVKDLKELLSLSNVHNDLADLDVAPLLEGENLPWFWARETDSGLVLFFAHPACRAVRYPMRYGQSADASLERREAILRYNGRRIELTLEFNSYESLLVRVGRDGSTQIEDLEYIPRDPRRSVET